MWMNQHLLRWIKAETHCSLIFSISFSFSHKNVERTKWIYYYLKHTSTWIVGRETLCSLYPQYFLSAGRTNNWNVAYADTGLPGKPKT